MRTADFDYALPPELIAQRPIEPRDHARLLVTYGGETGRWSTAVSSTCPPCSSPATYSSPTTAG